MTATQSALNGGIDLRAGVDQEENRRGAFVQVPI
jgi:hypothetical protein